MFDFTTTEDAQHAVRFKKQDAHKRALSITEECDRASAKVVRVIWVCSSFYAIYVHYREDVEGEKSGYVECIVEHDV